MEKALARTDVRQTQRPNRTAMATGWARHDKDGAMILEHAVLDVAPGSSAQFEGAFAQAKPIISASAGFRSLRLERCLEQPDRYVLLVEWDSVEAHEEGFRTSPAFEEWRRLLHHFYPSRPSVQHFETVLLA
jgi:heme-degrading monooxygenase HmoA